MPSTKLRDLFVVTLLVAIPAHGLEIRVQPDDHVYANRTEGRHSLYELVVHGVRLHNDSSEALQLEWVDVRASDDDGSQVIRRLLPRESRGAAATIEPGADLDFGAIFLASEFAPTRLEITARYLTGADGNEVATSIPVLIHEAEEGYGYPLQGSWYMRGIPSASSHHRWSLATEFAVDFFKVDAEGRISDGDRVDAGNYYGYGEPVLAAADGVVEMVIRGMKQDRVARMRRTEESEEAYSARMGELNQRAMQEHGLGGATGNLIVLRHPNGERTAYGHLKSGSLEVAEGNEVTRGQIIAEVGDTGDSPAVHLHFQVMEGAAMRSIPFRFVGVRVLSHELGSWVEPDPAE